MDVILPDDPTAIAFGVVLAPHVPVHGPDDRLMGRFIPAPRGGFLGPKWVTSDAVMARIREIDRIPPGTIVPARGLLADPSVRCIRVGSQSVAGALNGVGPDGAFLHSSARRLLGLFIPESRHEADEPVVVRGNPTFEG